MSGEGPEKRELGNNESNNGDRKKRDRDTIRNLEYTGLPRVTMMPISGKKGLWSLNHITGVVLSERLLLRASTHIPHKGQSHIILHRDLQCYQPFYAQQVPSRRFTRTVIAKTLRRESRCSASQGCRLYFVTTQKPLHKFAFGTRNLKIRQTFTQSSLYHFVPQRENGLRVRFVAVQGHEDPRALTQCLSSLFRAIVAKPTYAKFFVY